jgi:hypothetical protein
MKKIPGLWHIFLAIIPVSINTYPSSRQGYSIACFERLKRINLNAGIYGWQERK